MTINYWGWWLGNEKQSETQGIVGIGGLTVDGAAVTMTQCTIVPPAKVSTFTVNRVRMSSAVRGIARVALGLDHEPDVFDYYALHSLDYAVKNGTSNISDDMNAVGVMPGTSSTFPDNTTASIGYRLAFTTAGTYTIRLWADNLVTAYLDGTQIGMGGMSAEPSESTFAATAGTHTLKLVVFNEAGPCALAARIFDPSGTEVWNTRNTETLITAPTANLLIFPPNVAFLEDKAERALVINQKSFDISSMDYYLTTNTKITTTFVGYMLVYGKPDLSTTILTKRVITYTNTRTKYSKSVESGQAYVLPSQYTASAVSLGNFGADTFGLNKPVKSSNLYDYEIYTPPVYEVFLPETTQIEYLQPAWYLVRQPALYAQYTRQSTSRAWKYKTAIETDNPPADTDTKKYVLYRYAAWRSKNSVYNNSSWPTVLVKEAQWVTGSIGSMASQTTQVEGGWRLAASSDELSKYPYRMIQEGYWSKWVGSSLTAQPSGVEGVNWRRTLRLSAFSIPVWTIYNCGAMWLDIDQGSFAIRYDAINGSLRTDDLISPISLTTTFNNNEDVSEILDTALADGGYYPVLSTDVYGGNVDGGRYPIGATIYGYTFDGGTYVGTVAANFDGGYYSVTSSDIYGNALDGGYYTVSSSDTYNADVIAGSY